MGDFCDGMNGVFDGVMIAALELADGKNHAELARAEPDERRGFLTERGDQRCAERKSDGCGDGNAGAGEELDGGGGPDGIHHDGGEAVARCLRAKSFNLLARGIGLYERVIDDGGERLPTGESLGGKCGRVESSVIKIQIGVLDGDGGRHGGCS